MTIQAGSQIGPYEVTAPIGAGSMGEVYRATDTRLGRPVALKLLPEAFASDAERVRRFEREAKVLATLNHPGIAQIYGFEEATVPDGRTTHLLAMELVEGEDLAMRLQRGEVPVDEAIAIARQIAEALEEAHEKGIVHRDLKPGNVMVTEEGRVKVLDFGLAKLREGVRGAVDTQSPTEPATGPGRILGTAPYMSPEQVQGKALDHRSDVFALGSMLYEMATGERPFAGDTFADVASSILKDTPVSVTECKADFPRDLGKLIKHCLEKEPRKRFQSTLDLANELEELRREVDTGEALTSGGAPIAARRTGGRRRVWLVSGAVVAGGLVLVTAAVVGLWRQRQAELPPPTVVPLTSERLARGGSFSPDGTQTAFSSLGERENNQDIRLKIVGQAEARRLTTDPAADWSPAWSPDGMQIAFLRSDSEGGPARIYLVSLLGGAERRLSEFPAWARWDQLSWSPDGRWVAAAKSRSGSDPRGGIHLIPVAGGEPRAVTFPKPGAWDSSPSFSPDGRALAYVSCEGVEGVDNANAVCDLHAVPLDSDLRPREAARPLTQQRLPMIGLDWTRDGRSVIYSAGGGGGSYLWRVPVDGGAPPERVELAGRLATMPATARSRDRLVFTRNVWEPDLYRLQPGGRPASLLVSSFGEGGPQHSPDGRRLVFQSGRAGGVQEIWLAEADGSNPVRLTRGPGQYRGSPSWSPDGRSIAFDSYGEDGHADIWTIGVEGSGLRQVTRDPADDMVPSWSRDGRFLYFGSNRTGRNEIWRVPAEGGAEEQVTREGGGSRPSESLDGRTLYYMRNPPGALMARPSAGGPERTIVGCVEGANYAVASRGLFYVGCETEDGPIAPLWTLRFLDAASGEARPVAMLEADWVGGVSVSPDGQSIVYARSVRSSDLLMIENSR